MTICEAGCGRPIEGEVAILTEDVGTPDEYVGPMHPECMDERFALLDEIAALVGLPSPVTQRRTPA